MTESRDSAPSEAVRDEGDETPIREHVLVTGYPGFIARRLTEKIVSADPHARVTLLVSEADEASARAFIAGMDDPGTRVDALVGSVECMDLGLSGAEYRDLIDRVTTIHHLAGIDDTTAQRDVAAVINIEGTRNIIEMASEVRQLRRLCHYSTTDVSGKRKGLVREGELDHGQAFHNPYERTRFKAETLARAAQRRIPVSIFRLGLVVGDSVTGEIDRFDGPYYWLVLIATNQTQVSVPLPGRGSQLIHLVPVDFVVDASHALSLDERAAGLTFHITDPDPLPTGRVYELVADHSRTPPPRGHIPGGLARAVLGIPGVGRLARGPRFFLDALDHDVSYNCQNTLELLSKTDIRCPAFDAYVANLVRFVKAAHARPDPTALEPDGSTEDGLTTN